MCKLDAPASALRMDELDDPREARGVLILPDTQIVRRDTAFRQHGGGFQDYEAGATLCAAANVDQVPVVGKAVMT
jgi:hypothetical protein